MAKTRASIGETKREREAVRQQWQTLADPEAFGALPTAQKAELLRRGIVFLIRQLKALERVD